MPSVFPIAARYALWSFLRSLLHRGWWLVTSLYLVLEAGLSPFELVMLGTAQGLTVLLAEVPAGVFADAISRKGSLLIAHALMGLGMVSTALVLSFPALMVTQMIWGLSWTFSSGADVAWLTDELNAPARARRALIRAAQWGQAGAVLGLLGLGALAWASSLATAMIVAGIGMWLLGLAVLLAFPETRFQRAAPGRVLATAQRTFGEGLQTVRRERVLVFVLLGTLLVNGADEAFVRLQGKQLLTLGAPDAAAPVVWFTVIAVLALFLSLAALEGVQRYLQRTRRYASAYRAAVLLTALALLGFALAPTFGSAAIAVLLATGAGMVPVRTVSELWANEHATDEVRATVQSLLTFSENLGEVTLGFLLALLAAAAGIPAAMVAAAGLCLLVVALIGRGV
ncbi:MAG: MFS transporter [Pseudomonadota bacterium]